jgi:hypothetical protein
MTTSTLSSPRPTANDARRIAAKRLLERRQAAKHPASLLSHVTCVDSTTGERFSFELLEEDAGWYWQRTLLDEWMASEKHISLKARQLGITWLAGGLALWTLLYTPGSQVLCVSIKEEEAVKVVNRIWDMLGSLPDHLRNGAKVIKPSRGRPTGEIQVQFPDGRVSVIRGLTSTPSAGHGSTAALVILDEFSRQPYAAETWKAVLPTVQGGGRVLVISTGNGVSSPDGGGNFFHHLWVQGDDYGLHKRFLAWDLHPERDETWYRIYAEALPPADRGEQYPRDEDEAFILTGRPYFDREALAYYRKLIPEPKFRFDFVAKRGKAKLDKTKHGRIRVYQEPVDGRAYAIGVDVATGRGADFSAAYVVDLHDSQLVAEFHAKLDADLYAEQLHYLGRWYNGALLAVESAGGFGEAVIIPLRDGKADRPAYPKLYRHVLSSRPDLPVSKPFGYPMNSKTRPLVISQLEKAIRERTLPFMPQTLWDEARTFIHAETNPSPRAQDGCNDDAVFAAAIALEMYRLRGHHPKREARLAAKRTKRKRLSSYPWQRQES